MVHSSDLRLAEEILIPDRMENFSLVPRNVHSKTLISTQVEQDAVPHSMAGHPYRSQ